MTLKTIYVFGNPDLEIDLLPIKILPQLQKNFVDIEFKTVDPNEEWEVPEDLVIIDTVVGIKKITVFDNLKKFLPAPHVSIHDFDAYANLRYLEKLGKLKKIKIIGVPSDINEKQALRGVIDVLDKIIQRRKFLRLPEFDYSQAGYYFVTICVKDRKCLFGEAKNGEMVLSDVGRVIEKYLLEIPRHYKNVGLDIFVVMPNHIHVIILINNSKNVGAITDRPYRYGDDPDVGAITDRPYRYGLLSIIVKSFKDISSKEIRCLNPNFLWHRSFYDHIVRDEKSLEKIREYIQNNPLQWELDEENPNNIRK